MLARTSARTLILGAVFFGITLAPAFAESSRGTLDGATITDGTGPYDSSTGGDGYNGHAGDDGGNGGNGGDVTTVISTPSSGPFDGAEASSIGGDGGYGGSAMQGDTEGRDAVSAGNGGIGGDGGTVDLTIAGQVDGTVRARSLGGTAGGGGEGAAGYDGLEPMESGDAGVGGAGGEISLTVASTGLVNGTVYAVSAGGTSNGRPSGQGGDIAVTISGVVEGSVVTKSDGAEGGKIKVMVDGGVVTGTISASTNNDSSLAFKFDVADRAEFKAATAALTGSGAEGKVTINGQSYKWEGFSTLVNLLRYAGPEDKVVVSVKESQNDTTTVGEPAFTRTASQANPESKPEAPRQQPKLIGDVPLIVGKPERATCSGGSEIRTVRLDNGSLAVIHRTRGTDSLIGKLEDGTFHRASNAPDWTIQVGEEGKSVQVSDATGNALSNCSFS